MSIEAMKMALEALEDVQEAYGNHSKWFKDRVDALRQAIEQAEHVHAVNTSQERVDETAERKHMTDLASVGEVGVWGEREWVGLTRDERMDIINRLAGQDWVYVVDAIEAKLKEKNQW
jgi:hypothetical protein